MIGPIEKVYAGIHGKSICKKLPVLHFLATVLWPHSSMYEMFPYFVLLLKLGVCDDTHLSVVLIH